MENILWTTSENHSGRRLWGDSAKGTGIYCDVLTNLCQGISSSLEPTYHTKFFSELKEGGGLHSEAQKIFSLTS
ncbi:MAG TPA: hypothetical protein VJK47_04335 [Dehalococcoidales bacterium]|nr:hypothetical protein [Dehalococcoidales bacterium]